MSTETKQYPDVDASPVKSFFVSMLTRDIQLEDAILDLLDNCVDGILRTNESTCITPYDGYKAEIKFNHDSFEISDNCGGIPWDLHDYAFRMGRSPERPRDAAGSVGVYGIGMKRAIFKLGMHCLISSKHQSDQYEVEIEPDWVRDERRWHIPVRAAEIDKPYDGTTIVVGELHRGIAETFGAGAKAFTSSLTRMIATHYAYIIEKGFEVVVNGESIAPRTTKLVADFSSPSANDVVRPFVFRTESDGVDVYLAVGFTRPIPTENEINDDNEVLRYSSQDAGWTILCNDRAVVYCDRSELTGWGEARVPRYHTQFIAIAGIVEFKSDDPSKLPTTTTKRGIDASSPLYLQVKNKMREGMRVFTDYTNKWKGQAEDAKQHIDQGVRLSLNEIKKADSRVRFTTTRTLPQGQQHKPRLPVPPKPEPTMRRITFYKEISKIKEVADYLGDSDMQPSEVGEDCFDTVYQEFRG